MTTTRLNFKEVRDLGAIIQDSASFIRKNIVNILKPSLLLALVPIILGSLYIAISMKNSFQNIDRMDMYNSNPFYFMKSFLLGYLLIGIGMLLYFITIIAYIKQYVNGNEEINLRSLWPDIQRNIPKVFFSGILIMIITVLGYAFCFFPGIYLHVIFAQFFVIMIIEDTGFSDSFSRSFYIIKDNWWSTFGLYLVTYLINMAIAFIVVIPMYIFMFVKMFAGMKQSPDDPSAALSAMSSIAWFMPFIYLISLLTVMIFIVVSAFKYYSLVEEKEGAGEKEAINRVG